MAGACDWVIGYRADGLEGQYRSRDQASSQTADLKTAIGRTSAFIHRGLHSKSSQIMTQTSQGRTQLQVDITWSLNSCPGQGQGLLMFELEEGSHKRAPPLLSIPLAPHSLVRREIGEQRGHSFPLLPTPSHSSFPLLPTTSHYFINPASLPSPYAWSLTPLAATSHGHSQACRRRQHQQRHRPRQQQGGRRSRLLMHRHAACASA
eukprot:364747-Chlamydomonas_euryale.AAC.11